MLSVDPFFEAIFTREFPINSNENPATPTGLMSDWPVGWLVELWVCWLAGLLACYLAAYGQMVLQKTRKNYEKLKEKLKEKLRKNYE